MSRMARPANLLMILGGLLVAVTLAFGSFGTAGAQTVTGTPTPSPSPTASPSPTPSTSASASGSPTRSPTASAAAVPSTGGQPGTSDNIWVVLASLGALATLAGGAAMVFARSRN